ncbi:MAG: hypothetical protein D6731_21290 [Planctomycetota bacterium]|nr:MAG: hypothetical protein D6731_21290 [Planctomycetota bacterium]
MGGGLLLLGLAALLRPSLQAQQERAGLLVPAAQGDGLSADVAVPALALGAFRGVVTDYLWLRSLSLREQGRHYEARQLAEQIGRLQPRLSQVWSYLAHDLAYNLAATESDWRGRWRWIQNGIALLRDEGLRLNPGDPELYFMLSRIYQDKIGAAFDDFHLQFKREHAQEMRVVLGDLRVEELAATPLLDALLRADPEVRALAARAEAVEIDLEDLPLHEVVLAAAKASPHPLWEDFFARERPTEAYRRALRSARRTRLERQYKLEPARMLEVDRSWGPLDWRAWQATAIYWALAGVQAAEERGDLPARLRLRRIAVQALKDAMRQGRIEVLPDGRIFLAPDVDLVARVDEKYLESIALAQDLLVRLEGGAHEEEEHRHGRDPLDAVSAFAVNQKSAREDFLAEAVITLTQYGREAEARAFLARARLSYPENPGFQLSYDQFVIVALAQRYADPGTFDTQVGTSQLLEGTWTTAYKLLALGQDERFRGLRRLALATQQRWNRVLAGRPPVDRARLSIPYEAIRRRAAYRAFQQLPSPALRERLARRLGVTVAELATPPEPVPLPPPRGMR